ncbi:carbon-nitrogen hydrolase family protein [Thalassotalea atypica]|uniref:carbon-nitrogen hydrolase family protein n=1 Tax=Thalassotalea atypica TaxID=2054316 RepID=UPI00257238A1|nr:carbon-nitrogen hydrolase family protein [Thalassotalea atypica]
MAKLSVIQLCSVPDVNKNLATIEQILSGVNKTGLCDPNHLVVLPECCLFFGGNDHEQLLLAKSSAQDLIAQNALVKKLATIAIKYQVYLVAGSIPVLCKRQTDKFTNSSLVISPQGEVLADYAKIHLFDVVVDDNEKNYLESKYTQAGQRIVTASLPFAKLGLSICYDLRFPELYRSLTNQGVDIITVPAAFTKVTGQAHWQALLQARAIENQVYILAAGQEGVHANGRETWGHSMIISPWGEILAELTQEEGIVSVPFNREKIAHARSSIPVAKHNQFQIEMKR